MAAATVLAAGQASAGPAGPTIEVARADPTDGALAEASKRFGVPVAWLKAVIAVESSGSASAVSHAGAQGLMQLMPATYAELRDTLGLGPDPFNPHDNIIAGAAYVRELLDQFGETGFLAAYNAGPGRYRQHLTTGRPLPPETRAYVARLSPAIQHPAPTAPVIYASAANPAPQAPVQLAMVTAPRAEPPF